MLMYAIIWFYIIIMTTFWRSFLIRWIGKKLLKINGVTLWLGTWVVYICSNSWLLAVGSRDLSQALEVTVAKPEQIHDTWANSWQLFSLKMVKSCHFEWKQLSFFKFARLWQHLKFVFSKKATKLDEIFTVNLRLTT